MNSGKCSVPGLTDEQAGTPPTEYFPGGQTTGHEVLDPSQGAAHPGRTFVHPAEEPEPLYWPVGHLFGHELVAIFEFIV